MSEEEGNQNTIQCSKCNTINPKTNLFCRSCGSPFVDKVKCHTCGSEMPSYNSFCSRCGAVLRQTRATPRPGSIAVSTTETIPYDQRTGQQYQQPISPQYPTQDYETYAKKAQLETANTIGTIFGFILIGIGIIGILLFIILIAFSPSAIDFAAQGLTSGTYYASLTALFIPASITFIISGYALIAYRPENNAWKGFYYSLRYIFIGFSGLLSLGIIIVMFSWIFYNSNDKISGDVLFWLFYDFRIHVVGISLILFYSLISLVFFSCIGLMITYTILDYKKMQNKEEESLKNEEVSTKKDVTESLEMSSEIIIKNDISKEKQIIELSVLEERKGRLTNIFYIIKNSPLIGSIELLGASYLLSIIVVFILTPFIDEGETSSDAEPLPYVISLALAGILEEISFRLILIGVPMVFVVLIRCLRKNQKENVSYLNKSDINNKSLDVLEKTESEKDLSAWKIPLAIRGKYDKIGYPEWILIGISSILFGFAHWEKWTGSWGAWKIIQASLGGFFLSYAFVKYGIESSIFIHTTNNAVAGLSTFAFMAGANWIGTIATFVTFSLFGIGAMKIVGVIINFGIKLYYRNKDKTDQLQQI